MSESPNPTPAPPVGSGRLAGRLALITGASRGIGEAMAAACCREGARVIIVSRKQEGIEAAAARIREAVPGAEVFPQVLHVGRLEELEAAVRALSAEHGLIDILINNAAANPYFGPMLGLEMWAFDKTFEVNLKGPWLLSKAVAQGLMDAGEPGSILFTSSVFGQQAAPFQGVYGMTKAALISLTKTLAFEWAGAGIRVNAICPGLVDTYFAKALVENDDLRRRFTDRAALGRVGQPEEIAGLAVFLASSEASLITGQAVTVDGGYTIS